MGTEQLKNLVIDKIAEIKVENFRQAIKLCLTQIVTIECYFSS